MLENVGSNPTILTDLYCPVAQRWCGWLLTRRVQVRVLPGQLDTEGRANRHDGTRLEAGRGASPCRFESCPFRFATGACSRESSLPPKQARKVRLLPPLLAVFVTEKFGHQQCPVWQMIREVITSTEDVRWAPLCPPVHS